MIMIFQISAARFLGDEAARIQGQREPSFEELLIF